MANVAGQYFELDDIAGGTAEECTDGREVPVLFTDTSEEYGGGASPCFAGGFALPMYVSPPVPPPPVVVSTYWLMRARRVSTSGLVYWIVNASDPDWDGSESGVSIVDLAEIVLLDQLV